MVTRTLSRAEYERRSRPVRDAARPAGLKARRELTAPSATVYTYRFADVHEGRAVQSGRIVDASVSQAVRFVRWLTEQRKAERRCWAVRVAVARGPVKPRIHNG